MLPLPSSWRLHVLLILPVHCISCFAITFVCCPSVLKDDHRTYGPRWDANQTTVPAYHRGVGVCYTTKLHALGRTANATGQPEQYYHDVIPISCPASSDTPVHASPTTATAFSSARPANFSAKLKCQLWPCSITQQLSPQSISTTITEPSSCTNTSELQCAIPRSFKHSRKSKFCHESSQFWSVRGATVSGKTQTTIKIH